MDIIFPLQQSVYRGITHFSGWKSRRIGKSRDGQLGWPSAEAFESTCLEISLDLLLMASSGEISTKVRQNPNLGGSGHNLIGG